LSSKLRNLAVKATGPELNASSVVIHSQPVDILERFIQRNGGYEEWAKYTGWKSDLLKNYFNIQRAKGGNLENLGIKGLITEEDMNDEEFILGIKQQFIDISSKGHVHNFVANAMKSRPGSRGKGEDLDYINYEVDENNRFTGGKNTKLSSRVRGKGEDKSGDHYEEEEENKSSGNRELQSNSMRVKGKPARFFGNPFRKNEGNHNEFNQGKEYVQKNGNMGKNFDGQNEDEYEEGDDYEYNEGRKDENGNMRGRGGKIIQGKPQGKKGNNREGQYEGNEYEEENMEGVVGKGGKVASKNGNKFSKDGDAKGLEGGAQDEEEDEQGDEDDEENEYRGGGDKMKASQIKNNNQKLNRENREEQENGKASHPSQKGEGHGNSSGFKGKKKSKKGMRFGENQMNGIEENDYEDEDDEVNSDELSGERNEEENGGAKKDKAKSKAGQGKNETKDGKVGEKSGKTSNLDNNKNNKNNYPQDDENSTRGEKGGSDEISSNENGEIDNTPSLNSLKNKKKQTATTSGKVENQAKNNIPHNNKNNKANLTKNTKQLTLKKDENTRRNSSLSPNSKLINEVEEKVKRGRELLEEGEPQLYAKQHYQDFCKFYFLYSFLTPISSE